MLKTSLRQPPEVIWTTKIRQYRMSCTAGKPLIVPPGTILVILINSCSNISRLKMGGCFRHTDNHSSFSYLGIILTHTLHLIHYFPASRNHLWSRRYCTNMSKKSMQVFVREAPGENVCTIIFVSLNTVFLIGYMSRSSGCVLVCFWNTTHAGISGKDNPTCWLSLIWDWSISDVLPNWLDHS